MAFFPAKYILRSLGTARRERGGGRALSRLEAVTQFGADDGKVTTLELGRRSQSPPLQSPTEFVNNSFLSPFSLPPRFLFFTDQGTFRVEGYRKSSEKLTVSAAVAAMAIKPAGPPADGGQKRLGWGASRLSINR